MDAEFARDLHRSLGRRTASAVVGLRLAQCSARETDWAGWLHCDALGHAQDGLQELAG